MLYVRRLIGAHPCEGCLGRIPPSLLLPVVVSPRASLPSSFPSPAPRSGTSRASSAARQSASAIRSNSSSSRDMSRRDTSSSTVMAVKENEQRTIAGTGWNGGAPLAYTIPSHCKVSGPSAAG